MSSSVGISVAFVSCLYEVFQCNLHYKGGVISYTDLLERIAYKFKSYRVFFFLVCFLVSMKSQC